METDVGDFIPWPCEVTGNAEKPALVFLHGFMGRGADWVRSMQPVAPDYFCIAPDLPGHGRNIAKIEPPPLSFRHLSVGLARTLRCMGVRTANLVGYSLGGRLAQFFTLAYPRRVRALALESASPGLVERVERRQRLALDDQRAEQLLGEGMEAFVDAWYAMPLFASLAKKPGLLEAQKIRCKGNQADWMARVVSDLSPGRQPSLWGRLSRLQMPVLLIAGELDSAYTSTVLKMAAVIPNSKVTIAPAAGHNVHLETPDWFDGQISQFFFSRSYP